MRKMRRRSPTGYPRAGRSRLLFFSGCRRFQFRRADGHHSPPELCRCYSQHIRIIKVNVSSGSVPIEIAHSCAKGDGGASIDRESGDPAVISSTGPRRANLREFRRKRVLPLLKRSKPSANILTQRTCGDTPKGSRTKFEPSQRSSQQRDGSIGISRVEVVKCRRRLNQRLQETLLRLFQLQPNLFPMLVGKEKFRVPVAIEAFRQRSGIPVKGHIFSIDFVVGLPSPMPC